MISDTMPNNSCFNTSITFSIGTVEEPKAQAMNMLKTYKNGNIIKEAIYLRFFTAAISILSISPYMLGVATLFLIINYTPTKPMS